MAKKAKHDHHAVDYLELGSTDLAATKRFYTAAFGWTFNEYGDDYAGFVDPGRGREGGGFHAQKKIKKGGVLPILYSTDLAATLKAVKKAGGGVVKEIFEFPGGRRFHFTDPSGNELAVWSDQ
jgi:predicted enzyme related to lactoylglutathione lyase